MRTRASLPVRPSAGHSGATLTEVLMSLLVFSVGIVSVFTLFPISILQSIRATQLTNTRILYDNVQALAKARPEYWRTAASWEANKIYGTGARIWTGSLVYVAEDPGGTSGTWEPTWGGATVVDNGITWNRDDTPPSPYVVDPLGRVADPNFGPRFGKYGDSHDDPAVGIVRPNIGTRLGMTTAQLQAAFVLPDSWSVAFEAVPSGISGTTVSFPTSIDLSAVNATYRVVVISANLRKSAVRNVATAPTGNTITLNSALPTDLNELDEVSTVRLEYFNSRYTWLLSVSPLGRQCVIFFNRSFNPDDEHVYPYTINDAAGDRVTLNGIDWTTPKPLIREGNFVFDTVTCRWHRMIDVSITGSSATVVLDRGLEGAHESADPSDDSVTLPTAFGGLIFMPGIVHVFDL